VNCKDFKKIFPYFVDQLNQGNELDEDLEEDWSDHLNECKDCYTWFASEQLILRGYDPDDFPCPHVGFHATHECDTHDSAFECPHHIIVNVEGEWGIPIKDENQSMVPIDNCPWCGVVLKTGWPKRSVEKSDKDDDLIPVTDFMN